MAEQRAYTIVRQIAFDLIEVRWTIEEYDKSSPYAFGTA